MHCPYDAERVSSSARLGLKPVNKMALSPYRKKFEKQGVELTRLYLQMGIVNKDENIDAQAWLAEQDRMNLRKEKWALSVDAGVYDYCGRDWIDCCVAHHQSLVSLIAHHPPGEPWLRDRQGSR
jgi:hypothetical protein